MFDAPTATILPSGWTATPWARSTCDFRSVETTPPVPKAPSRLPSGELCVCGAEHDAVAAAAISTAAVQETGQRSRDPCARTIEALLSLGQQYTIRVIPAPRRQVSGIERYAMRLSIEGHD